MAIIEISKSATANKRPQSQNNRQAGGALPDAPRQ